jgi:glycosyltransferase involved in cell wall biosynthesis
VVVMITGRSPLLRRGGLETFVSAHALAAARAGYDVHVFCVASRSRQGSEEWGTLHEVATPVRPLSSFMVALHAPFVRRAVVDHVLRARPREPLIIHGFGAWSAVGVGCTQRLDRAGIEAAPVASAYTTLVHEQQGLLDGIRRGHGVRNWGRYVTRYLWVRAMADREERRGYTGSEMVLVNYQAVSDLLTRSFGAGLKIRRVPYASDLAFRSEEGMPPVPPAIARLKPEHAPLIVSVSRHDPRKGIDVLLHALAGLADGGPPFRACLVGLGPTLEASRSLLGRLGLEDRVSITGHVPDVAAYLRRADVFVLPSLEEGGGSLSLLEALQSGTAIVASRCDGIPEDVRLDAAGGGEDAALLVDPGDPSALQSALARALSDDALRSQLGARARAIHAQRFSAPALIDALGDVYSELGSRVTRARPATSAWSRFS